VGEDKIMTDDKRKVDAPQRPQAASPNQPHSDAMRARTAEHAPQAAAPQPAPAKPAPAPHPELMSDHDRKRLGELRAMSPGQMPARTPEQEAEFIELERREQDVLWSAQDARVAELQAKQLTPAEQAELQDLQVTIDNQRRAAVRRGDPNP
jgi:hypothetical protein